MLRPRKNWTVSFPRGAAPEKNFSQQEKPSSARSLSRTSTSKRVKRIDFSSSLLWKHICRNKNYYNCNTTNWMCKITLSLSNHLTTNLWLASKPTDMAQVSSFFFTYAQCETASFIFSMIFSQTRGTPIWDEGLTSFKVSIKLPWNRNTSYKQKTHFCFLS